VIRALSIGWLMFKRPFLLPRIRKASLEYVDGTPIVVWPDVLNPVVFRSGEWFARSLAELAPVESSANPTLLDVGTGSGVCAIVASRLGYRVTAVDINPEAVRCARINALLNHVETRVEVLQGDLFEPVATSKFDRVLFNPPFFRGQPRSLFDMAWRGTDVLERFAEGLGDTLTPAGSALILLSTEGDASEMLTALEQQRMEVTIAARRHFGNEVMTIYRARPIRCPVPKRS
jgi:release factor glutamine methyltransferase